MPQERGLDPSVTLKIRQAHQQAAPKMMHMGEAAAGVRRGEYLVVAGQSVDSALHENQAELGVLVLAVHLQVLAHGHGLLD